MIVVYKIEQRIDGMWYVVSHEVPSLGSIGGGSPKKDESGPHSTKGEAMEKMRGLATAYVKDMLNNAYKVHIENISNSIGMLSFHDIIGSLCEMSKAVDDAIRYCNSYDVNNRQSGVLCDETPMNVLDIENVGNSQYVLRSISDPSIDGMTFTTEQSAFDVWNSYVRKELKNRLVEVSKSINRVKNEYGINQHDLDKIIKMVNEAIDYCIKCRN